MNKTEICPVCKENQCATWSTVDVYSDTSIDCCEDCREMLAKAKRYQWHGNMPKLFLQQNRQKLRNATDTLLLAYEREYARFLQRKESQS